MTEEQLKKAQEIKKKISEITRISDKDPTKHSWDRDEAYRLFDAIEAAGVREVAHVLLRMV